MSETEDIETERLSAATWLLDDWPFRFTDCCREANVEYPALNRNVISIANFHQVAMIAYSVEGRGTLKSRPTRKGPNRELAQSEPSVDIKEAKRG
jgi:hypothetical protein